MRSATGQNSAAQAAPQVQVAFVVRTWCRGQLLAACLSGHHVMINGNALSPPFSFGAAFPVDADRHPGRGRYRSEHERPAGVAEDNGTPLATAHRSAAGTVAAVVAGMAACLAVVSVIAARRDPSRSKGGLHDPGLHRAPALPEPVTSSDPRNKRLRRAASPLCTACFCGIAALRWLQFRCFLWLAAHTLGASEVSVPGHCPGTAGPVRLAHE